MSVSTKFVPLLQSQSGPGRWWRLQNSGPGRWWGLQSRGVNNGFGSGAQFSTFGTIMERVPRLDYSDLEVTDMEKSWIRRVSGNSSNPPRPVCNVRGLGFPVAELRSNKYSSSLVTSESMKTPPMLSEPKVESLMPYCSRSQ